MLNRTCPSVKSLMEIKDVTQEDAEKIRAIWKTVTLPGKARNQIDTILRTHGVEYLGWHKRRQDHIYYCNAGDTYATTVTFIGQRMHVACWADYIERNMIEQPY